MVLLDMLFLQPALASWSGGSAFIKFGIVVSTSILIGFGISHFMVRPYPRQFILIAHAACFCWIVVCFFSCNLLKKCGRLSVCADGNLYF